MNWYLYALARSPGSSPAGIGGKPVFAAAHRGIRLLASAWADSPAPLRASAHILAHEDVVGAAAAAGPVLPFRFGTIANETACLAFVDRHAERIMQRLQAVAGQVEVSLKVLEPAGQAPAQEQAPPTGTIYLLRRQRAAHREQERVQRAAELIAAIEATLAPWITERRQRLAPTPHVLAVMTHLIPAAALDPWAKAVSGLRSGFPGLDFLASGPWPPYHFAEVTKGDAATVPDPGPPGQR